MSFQFFNKASQVFALCVCVGALSACGSGSKFTSSSLASAASATSTTSTASGTASGSAAASTDVTTGNFQILAQAPKLPTEVSDIVVTVSSIDLRDAAGDDVSLPVSSLSIDFAALSNAGTSILQSTVTAGNYNQIRFIYSAIVVTYANGKTESLDFASSSTVDPRSIMTVPIGPSEVIAADAVSHAMIDFGRRPKGGPGGGPHDQLGLSVINLDATGEVSGVASVSATDTAGVTTATAIEGAEVVVLKNGRPAGFAITDASGSFLMLGVEPGTYEIRVMAKGYEDFTATSVSVTAGAVTSQDAALTTGQ